jgi:hypothetical protein
LEAGAESSGADRNYGVLHDVCHGVWCSHAYVAGPGILESARS